MVGIPLCSFWYLRKQIASFCLWFCFQGGNCMYQCEEFSVVLDPFYRKISCIFLNEMKYKQEETLFETLYLHLQEEYSLFLPRKPCPRSWRTYCTSRFRASNWEDVPLLDQIDRKIFSVHFWEKAHLSVRKVCRSSVQ